MIDTSLKFSGSTAVTKVFWEIIEEFTEVWVGGNRDLSGTGLDEGWAISQLTLYDVQMSLADGVKQTLGVSMATAFVVLLATTMNLPITVAGMLCIGGILGSTIAILIGEGWKLSILESIVFSVAVGLSVDFCVHYSWSILMSIKEGKGKREIVMRALVQVGPSILMVRRGWGYMSERKSGTRKAGRLNLFSSFPLTHTPQGAATTMVAGFVLLMCETLFFLRFGVFLIVCMGMSWIWSTFFLMTLVCVLPESWLRFNGGAVWGAVKEKVGVKGSVVLSQVDEDEGTDEWAVRRERSSCKWLGAANN